MAIIKFGDEQAYVEITPNAQNEQSGSFQRNANSHKNENVVPEIDAEQIGKMVKMSSSIFSQLRELEADQAEICFGITIGAEGGFFCFAKASAEAQFEVKLTWKKRAKACD